MLGKLWSGAVCGALVITMSYSQWFTATALSQESACTSCPERARVGTSRALSPTEPPDKLVTQELHKCSRTPHEFSQWSALSGAGALIWYQRGISPGITSFMFTDTLCGDTAFNLVQSGSFSKMMTSNRMGFLCLITLVLVSSVVLVAPLPSRYLF